MSVGVFVVLGVEGLGDNLGGVSEEYGKGTGYSGRGSISENQGVAVCGPIETGK